MANAARATFYYGQANTGWSETWWYPPGISGSFWQRVMLLANRRNDLLGPNHFLIAVRATEEGGERKTRLVLGGGPTALDAGSPVITLPGRGREDGIGTNLEGPSDQVRAAIHCEVISGGRRVGLRYLAGIPDDISLTENPTLNKDFQKKWWNMFADYRDQIINQGWAIKALDKSANFPLIPVQTYRMRAAAPSVLGLVFDAALPFTGVVGQQIALQGVRMLRRGQESPNGTYYIDGTEVNQPLGQRTVWLRGTEGFDPEQFLTLGKFRHVSYTYIQPTWFEPIRVGVHKRGKPFGSPVGRRTTR